MSNYEATQHATSFSSHAYCIPKLRDIDQVPPSQAPDSHVISQEMMCGGWQVHLSSFYRVGCAANKHLNLTARRNQNLGLWASAPTLEKDSFVHIDDSTCRLSDIAFL